MKYPQELSQLYQDAPELAVASRLAPVVEAGVEAVVNLNQEDPENQWLRSKLQEQRTMKAFLSADEQATQGRSEV